MSRTTDWEGGPDGSEGGAGAGGAPSGPASGDLSGDYPDPAVSRITELDSTSLAIGAVGAGEMLQRSGLSLVGVKGVVSLSVPALSNEMAFFSGTSGQSIVGGSGFTRDPGGPRLKANITDASTIQGITYRDNANSATSRFAFKVGNDLVEIANTAANGVILITPNTSTAGSGGAQTAARFEDDLIQWSTGAAVRMQVDDVGQVGIPTPVSEALLALTSTTKAFGLPAMTETQRDAITATAGFEAFNTSTGVPSFADGADWFDVAKATAAAAAQADATLALERRFSYYPSSTSGTTVMERQVSSVFDARLVGQTVDGVPTTGTHVNPLRNLVVVEITTLTTGGTLRLTGTSFDPSDGSTTVSDTEDIVIGATGWFASAKRWDGAVSVVLSSIGGLDVILDSYNFHPIDFGPPATFTINKIECTWEATGGNSMRLQVQKIAFPAGPTTVLDETVSGVVTGGRPTIISTAVTAIAPGEALIMAVFAQRAASVAIHIDGDLSA